MESAEPLDIEKRVGPVVGEVVGFRVRVTALSTRGGDEIPLLDGVLGLGPV